MIQKAYNEAIKRLVALGGTDEGFYVLALHAFVEGFCNSLKPGFTYYANFNEVIDFLLEQLERRGGLQADGRRSLIRLAKEHDLGNRVRHQFSVLTADEAIAATHNFLGFCAAFSISDPGLAELKAAQGLWEKRSAPIEIIRELEKTRSLLAGKERSELALQDQLAAFADVERRLREISLTADEAERELARSRETASKRDVKVDELRKRLNDTARERDKVLAELEGYKDLGTYIEYLERFTAYTRTRLDYERSVLLLSQEQADAVHAIRDRGDYAIRGSAGTGKTLVLLHALEHHMEEAGSPQQETHGKVILLTYTNTLVKYSRYLSGIVGRHGAVPHVATADSYLLGLLRSEIPGASIDFNAPRNIISGYNTTSFFSDDELAVEIEEVIWGNLVSREEYLEKHILRKGMKQPLGRQQREIVWAIQIRLRDALVASKKLSRNLAAMELVSRAGNEQNPSASANVDRIYIDEAQDLPTAMVRLMKLRSRFGLVLAVDDGQSIYKVGSPYLRAGLMVAGHTRTLKVNFRNTRQVHEFAERLLAFNQTSDSGIAGTMMERKDSSSSREGPVPEVVKAATEQALLAALVRYVQLATGRLGYDPENIGILAPSNATLDRIKDSLSRVGIESVGIRDDDFEFSKPGIVRLATMHSSKGIEFPVTMVFVPTLIDADEYDERSIRLLQRNLLYVSITRAMDYAVILTLDNSINPVLQELCSLVL